MKTLFYQRLLSCMLVIFSILSISSCDSKSFDTDIAAELVGTWSDSQVQSATGSTRYISVTINEDGTGEFYFESLAYLRVAYFTWTFRNQVLTCSGAIVETTSDGETDINRSWVCSFEYTGSALIPKTSPYKDFVLTQSGRPSGSNGSEDKEDTDPNIEFACGAQYFMSGGKNNHIVTLAWSIPSGMRSKGLSVFGIAIRCKNGEITNKNGHENGMHIKSVGSYKYFHAAVQDNETNFGVMMYVTCSDPKLEFEYYPLYTLDNKEIEGVKRSMTVTVSADNNDNNEDTNDYSYTSLGAAANCYIVSKSGSYKFRTVKGNSSTSVGSVSKAEVLWESFGTSTKPSVGDLIKSVTYKDGYILFNTANTFKEGNAVIAAKDANGTILWSWHIWLTDQPQNQVYYNNAGTMMDRNLGATSTTPGDVGALGLFYQWGRKDPFMGPSSISEEIIAKSTLSWPLAVQSDSSCGTIAYAIANPTTFITSNSNNKDWYYTSSSSTDDTRWTESSSTKSIYDPCPAGWRIPDGEDNGVWSKTLGSSQVINKYPYDDSNRGIDFSGKFGSASIIWYPACGYLIGSDGSFTFGGGGYYWSASTYSKWAYGLRFYTFSGGGVAPSESEYRAYGRVVRCIKE